MYNLVHKTWWIFQSWELNFNGTLTTSIKKKSNSKQKWCVIKTVSISCLFFWSFLFFSNDAIITTSITNRGDAKDKHLLHPVYFSGHYCSHFFWWRHQHIFHCKQKWHWRKTITTLYLFSRLFLLELSSNDVTTTASTAKKSGGEDKPFTINVSYIVCYCYCSCMKIPLLCIHWI